MNEATISNPPANPTSSNAARTPGWKTSEFWMTAVGQAGLVLAAAGGLLPAKYAALAGALSQVAYSVSRGLAKSGLAAAN